MGLNLTVEGEIAVLILCAVAAVVLAINENKAAKLCAIPAVYCAAVMFFHLIRTH